MSAEVLREAARLMRERAEAATQGPWTAEAIGSEGHHVFAPEGSRAPLHGRARVAACHWEGWDQTAADAALIASWHPAVARAVADLLDLIEMRHAPSVMGVEGSRCTWCVPNVTFPCDHFAEALAVARTYLGTQETTP